MPRFLVEFFLEMNLICINIITGLCWNMAFNTPIGGDSRQIYSACLYKVRLSLTKSIVESSEFAFAINGYRHLDISM